MKDLLYEDEWSLVNSKFDWVFLSKRIGAVQGGMSNGLRKIVPGGTIEIHSAHEDFQIKLIA